MAFSRTETKTVSGRQFFGSDVQAVLVRTPLEDIRLKELLDAGAWTFAKAAGPKTSGVAR
jgi:hypothetical protein